MATRRPAVPTSAQMRAQVLAAIAERLAQLGLTQKEAAARLGLAQPQVSALINERSEGFSLDRLIDRKSTRLNSSHIQKSRMPSSA